MTLKSGDARMFEFFNEIGIVAQLSNTRFEQNLPGQLTASQFGVLNNFVRLGGTRSPKQLADAFQVTKGAMTNTLAKLEAKGCVKIAADPRDGRAKVVSITAKGKRLRESAIIKATEAFRDLEGVLSDEDVAVCVPVLQKIRAHLDSHRD